MYDAIRNTRYLLIKRKAFTLLEVMTALVLLALIASGVLAVISRCVASATDSSLQIQAFEVARENMEKLLASNSVKETVEYGSSDTYPNINWQTVVETFYEPITNRMWVKAVCSAEYQDSKDETQTVELTHWLTDVSKEQLLQLMEQKEQEGAELAEQIIESIEEAADYAGVDVETIEQWIENGMLTAEDGSFIKTNLDIYLNSGGNPSDEEKTSQIESIAELSGLQEQESGTEINGQRQSGNVDPVTGLTYEQLDKMDFMEVLELLKQRYNKNINIK